MHPGKDEYDLSGWFFRPGTQRVIKLPDGRKEASDWSIPGRVSA